MIRRPEYFCPNCLCISCVEWSRMLAAEVRRVKGLEYQYTKRLEEARLRKLTRDQLAKMEGGMIWLLMNVLLEVHPLKIDRVVQDLAELFGYRGGQLSQKRVRIVHALTESLLDVHPNEPWYRRLRDAGAVGRMTFEAASWAKPPGTEGAELPEWCDECGHILPSKRAGFKRQPCTYCSRTQRLRKKGTL